MPTSSVRKAIEGFGDYASRRAPTYVKGKTGYAEGFLPPRSSPKRFPRPRPTIENTARQPSNPEKTKPATSEVGQWKQKSSDLRRSYMATHIAREDERIPRVKAENDAKRIEGQRKREALLNAPKSEFGLPTIAQVIADEYPLRDDNKAEREHRKMMNRHKKQATDEETRLHQFLTIHHNSARYVTTIEGLEALLEKRIGAAQYFDTVPKYKLSELVGQPGSGSYSFGKVNQLETAIDDHIMGTAGGGKPGVVEVGHILDNAAREADEGRSEAS